MTVSQHQDYLRARSLTVVSGRQLGNRPSVVVGLVGDQGHDRAHGPKMPLESKQRRYHNFSEQIFEGRQVSQLTRVIMLL
jgi:hypothetical protein